MSAAKHSPGPKNGTLIPQLSSTQLEALAWFEKNGPARRSAWRVAGIAATTVYSLRLRGLMDWTDTAFNVSVYAITSAGRAAIAKAGGAS